MKRKKIKWKWIKLNKIKMEKQVRKWKETERDRSVSEIFIESNFFYHSRFSFFSATNVLHFQHFDFAATCKKEIFVYNWIETISLKLNHFCFSKIRLRRNEQNSEINLVLKLEMRSPVSPSPYVFWLCHVLKILINFSSWNVF